MLSSGQELRISLNASLAISFFFLRDTEYEGQEKELLLGIREIQSSAKAERKRQTGKREMERD